MSEYRVNEVEEEISLSELFAIVKPFLLHIVLVSIVFALVSLIVTKTLIKPVYESSATIIVNNRKDDSNNAISTDEINSAKNLAAVYSIIIKSDAVMEPIIEENDFDITNTELSKKVSVSPVDNTQVIKISVKDSDPEMARRVNGVVLVIYPDSSKQLVDVKVMVLDNELDSEIYTPLRQDISTDLNVIPEAILGIANVEELPDGTTFTWKENPDVSKAGYFLETVIVTYPDESYDEVDVTIIVKDVVKEDIPVVEKEDTTEIVDLEKEKIEEKVPPTGIDYKYSIYVITLALGVALLLFIKNKKKMFK